VVESAHIVFIKLWDEDEKMLRFLQKGLRSLSVQQILQQKFEAFSARHAEEPKKKLHGSYQSSVQTNVLQPKMQRVVGPTQTFKEEKRVSNRLFEKESYRSKETWGVVGVHVRQRAHLRRVS
jgi:hypothetical protein